MNISDKSFEFVERLKSIGHYNENYDYSLVDYKNIKTKVLIIDKKFNSYHLISPEKLIYRNTKCFFKNAVNKTEYMKKQFLEVHDNLYDYSETIYERYDKPLKIKCKKHGYFFQLMNNHKKGHGCPKCSNNKKLNTNEIIKHFKEIWGELYDYSNVEYNGTHSKVNIICKDHGIFSISPSNHKNGWGCPMCNNGSKGEKKIIEILEKFKINFKEQFKFNKCKRKKKLSFDFYLPDHNICIEYDGIQHFKPVDFFGGKEYFKIQKINDNIKDVYCKNNNIRLIRIPYFEENIEEKLKLKLG